MANWGCKTRNYWQTPRYGVSSSKIEIAQDQGSHVAQ